MKQPQMLIKYYSWKFVELPCIKLKQIVSLLRSVTMHLCVITLDPKLKVRNPNALLHKT